MLFQFRDEIVDAFPERIQLKVDVDEKKYRSDEPEDEQNEPHDHSLFLRDRTSFKYN
jgi:hypothetical protein